MSLKTSFHAVARKIEREKSIQHVGTASVRLDVLEFRHSSGLDEKNVERLKRLFLKGGCFPGRFTNRIPALISAETLNESLALSNLSAEQLRSGADVSDGHARLELPAGRRLECLRGRHRAVAAEDVLDSENKRWVIDFFLADSSEDLRNVLIDEYANESNPDDGLFYFQIRLHQGIFGPRNRYFEHRWWARLSAISRSTNKEDRLRQLYRHREFAPAFDEFRSIPALYYGLRLSVVNKMISMGCQEELLSFLKHTRDFWYHHVFDNDEKAMRKLDPDTVHAVQLRAPGASEADHSALYDSLRAGAIFCNFDPDERRRLCQKLCAASKFYLVPSLFAFFENLKYLKAPLDCMKRLVCPVRRTSICAALGYAFTGGPLESSRCPIQSSPSTFIKVPVEPQDQFQLSYLQLWLYALREYKHMSPTVKKKLATPAATETNEQTLYEFAALAKKLGFTTDAIEDLLQQNPDRAMAKRLLLAARQPSQFQYHDLEHCIAQIVAVLSAASPRHPQEEVTQDDHGDENWDDCLVRAPELSIRRCGIPVDAHQLQDRPLLYLPKMLGGINESSRSITSFFVQRSMFFAFFMGENGIHQDYLADRNGETIAWERETQTQQSETSGGTMPPEGALASSRQTASVLEANLQQATTQLHDHRERFAQLDTAILSKKSHLQDMENSQDALQSRVQQLKQEEAQLQEKNQHIINEMEAHAQSLHRLEDEQRKMEQQQQEQTEKAHHAAVIVSRSESRAKELELRKEELESQILELQGKQTLNEKAVAHLHETHSELQKDTARYNKEKERYNEWHLQSKANFLELEEKKNGYQADIRELEGKRNGYEADNRQLEEKKNHYEADIRELEEKKNGYEADNRQLEEKKNHYEADIRELEEKKNGYEADNRQLEEKKNHYEADIRELEEKKNSHEANIEKLQSRETEHEEILESIREQIGDRTQEETKLQPKIQNLEEAAGPVEGGKVRIVFKEIKVTDALLVDASKPDQIRRVAAKYVRKHYGLFDKEDRNMTPANCFQMVTSDRTYTIFLRYNHAVQTTTVDTDAQTRLIRPKGDSYTRTEELSSQDSRSFSDTSLAVSSLGAQAHAIGQLRTTTGTPEG